MIQFYNIINKPQANYMCIKTYLVTNSDDNYHLNVFDWDNWLFTKQ